MTEKQQSERGVVGQPAITAHDGLLWRGDTYIPLPEADSIAIANGYTCAEQMVRALQAAQTIK
jgi:hypothetical protein